MSEKVQITREQMGPVRKAADTIAGAGNVIDVGTAVAGLILASPAVVAYALLSFLTGNYIRDEYIRKAPPENVVFDAQQHANNRSQLALVA